MRLFPVSCRLRCHSSLAQTLPPEEAPVDRPFWGVDDPSMPLPFDLADIINRVESLLWRWAQDVKVEKDVRIFLMYTLCTHILMLALIHEWCVVGHFLMI